MIASCPACAARFRLDRQRLGGKRISLRCPRCRNIFKVEIPASAASPSRLRVAVAHGDPALCATIRDLLAEEGLDCRVCYDAAALLQQMEVFRPQIAIIDAAIPGQYIFEVIDAIRNLTCSAEAGIILLSSVYNRAAYKRTPSSLYGADDYIEKHHIPDDLLPKIYALAASAKPAAKAGAAIPGLPVDDPVTDGAAIQEQSGHLKSQIIAAENGELTGAGDAVEKARRLARIIIADIALYSQEKVEEGLRLGSVRALLAGEIEEGRRLFEERIAPEVRRRGDFLEEALTEFLSRHGERQAERKDALR